MRWIERTIIHSQRRIDGYLAGLGNEKLRPALQQVSDPIDVCARDLGF